MKQTFFLLLLQEYTQAKNFQIISMKKSILSCLCGCVLYYFQERIQKNQFFT